MATEPRSRRRQRKKILRKDDGSMYDATERRRITPGELRDYVKDGGLFEARRHENGADCTYEVLQDVVGAGLMQNLVPGMGGGALCGLGGLAGLAGGGGPLSALGGGGGLAALARVIGDQAGRSADHGWDGWEEPRRRKARSSDDPAWADGEWSGAQPRRSSRRGPDDWVPDPDFD
jgi:hypothetical protein